MALWYSRISSIIADIFLLSDLWTYQFYQLQSCNWFAVNMAVHPHCTVSPYISILVSPVNRNYESVQNLSKDMLFLKIRVRHCCIVS